MNVKIISIFILISTHLKIQTIFKGHFFDGMQFQKIRKTHLFRNFFGCFQKIIFTLKPVRSFLPTPRGLEFRPGQDYHFISTSSRRDLNRRSGGSCATHNMKVIFKVAERGQEHGLGQRRGQGQPAINRPRERVEEEHVKPIERVGSFHTGLGQKREEGRRGTVKQEASTMSGSRSREQTYLHILLPLLLLLLAACTLASTGVT